MTLLEHLAGRPPIDLAVAGTLTLALIAWRIRLANPRRNDHR